MVYYTKGPHDVPDLNPPKTLADKLLERVSWPGGTE
jgi:hypothetical protein